MSYLLYLSYSFKLSKEEKLIIDDSISKNRLAIKNFIQTIYSKSKLTIISTGYEILIIISSQFEIQSGITGHTIPENQIEILKVNITNLNKSLQFREGEISPLTKFLIRFLFLTLGKTFSA